MMRKKLVIFERIPLAILFDVFFILVISLVPLFWFRPGEVMVGHDNVFPLNPQEFFRDRFFTWSQHHGFGYDQSQGMGSIIIHAIDVAPYYVGFDLQTTQKIVYCFWFFVLVISAYIFSFSLQRWGFITHRYFRLILPVLYAVNFYVLQAWWIGERTKFSAMATLPLLLTIFLGVVYARIKPVRAGILAAAMFFFLNGGGMRGLPLFGGVLIAGMTAFIYFGYFMLLKRQFAILKRLIVFFLTLFPLLLLLDAYLFFPFLSHTLQSYAQEIARIGGAASTLDWSDMISKDATISNLLRFQGIPEWYTSIDHPYGQQFIHRRVLIAASFIWSVLLIFSFLIPKTEKERRIFYFFCLLFLVSLIFARGTGQPTGFLYKFFVEYIPGFAVFRSPLYKFGYTYWFAGEVLIAWTLAYGLSFIQKFLTRGARLLTPLFLFILVAGIFIYHYPYLSGEIFSWSTNRLSTRVTVPQYIFDAADFVKRQGIQSRILLLPEANRDWYGDIYQWKFFSLYPLLADVSRHPFVFNNDSLTEAERSYLDELYDAILRKDPEQTRLLSSLLNIEYVILRDDYFADISWTPTTQPSEYEKSLKESGIFSQVKQFDKWKIYRIDGAEPSGEVFVSRSLVSFTADEFSPIRSADFFNGLPTLLGITQTQPRPVFIDVLDPKAQNFSDKIYMGHADITGCIDCGALTRQVTIVRPNVQILPNAVLYPVIDRRRQRTRIFSSNTAEINHLLGMSLLRAEELANLKRRRPAEVTLANHIEAVSKTTEKLKLIYNRLDTLLSLGANEKSWIENILREKQYLEYQYDLLTNPSLWSGDDDYKDFFDEVLFDLRNLSMKFDDVIFQANLYGSNYYYPHPIEGRFLSFLFSPSTSLQPLEKTSIISGISPASIGDKLTLDRSADQPLIVQNNDTTTFESDIKQITPLLENAKHTCFGNTLGDVKKGESYRIDATYTNGEVNTLIYRFEIFSQDETYTSRGFTRSLKNKKITVYPQASRSESYLFSPGMSYKSVFVGLCKPSFQQEEFNREVTQFSVHKITPQGLILWGPNEKWQKEESQDNITITRINQTKYKVDVVDNKYPFLLNFQEKYNSDWKLYKVPYTKKHDSIGTDAIVEPFFFSTWLNKPMPDTLHFTGNGYLNSWYIDDIGSYSLFIEYYPQQLFYQGMIVTFIGCIIVVVYFITRKKLK